MIEYTQERFGFYCDNCGLTESGTERSKYKDSSHGDALCPECGEEGEYADYRDE